MANKLPFVNYSGHLTELAATDLLLAFGFKVTTGTANDVLLADGTIATLTGGSGISITNSAGVLTFTVTGSTTVTEVYSGTQVATVGTEHILNTTSPETTSGLYELYLDTNALTANDAIQISFKEKVITGGTQHILFLVTLYGIQSSPIFTSGQFMLTHGWDICIKQTLGTSKSFPYSIRKVT